MVLAALAARFELQPNQISQWKQEFVENSQMVFSGAAEKEKEDPVKLDVLYAKIGQLGKEFKLWHSRDGSTWADVDALPF